MVDGRLSADGLEVLSQMKSIASKSVRPSYEGARIGVDISDPGPARFLDSHGGIPGPKTDLPVAENADLLLERALLKAGNDYAALMKFDVQAAVIRDIIGLTTWSYWRCPRSITEDLLSWYSTGEPRYRGGDLIVRLEGLGRILHESKDIRRFFSAIDRRLQLNEQAIRNPELSALTSDSGWLRTRSA